MAEYEFECRHCKKIFTLFMRVTERATAKIRCPGCDSADVEPLMQPFLAKTAKNITNDPNTDRDPVWIGNSVFFLADRCEHLNLYRYDTARGESPEEGAAVKIGTGGLLPLT